MKCKKISLPLASLAGVLLISNAGASPTGTSLGSTVRIDSGVIDGVPALTPNVMAFKGIPFAAAPVGDLRWKAPQPVASWPAVRNADNFGPACMQYYMQATSTANFGDYETKSEDCLYLNVWTPAKTGNDKLPVLVWIHGGGFRVGSATERLHHGDNLAAKGVILVSLNYRLGVFGFFAHPELTKESGHNASGDYGLMDQVAALKWVQRNIAAFGGDPKRVTIFGESAGAGAVSYLQASPLTEGLFQGAIGESGGSFARPAAGSENPLKTAEQNGVKFAASVGASSLAQLRAVSADQLLMAGAAFGAFSPLVDGYVVPEDIYKTFAEGRQHDVPVLVGSNSDEGTTLRGRPPVLTADDQRAEFAKLYPADKPAKITSGSMLWAMHTWASLETKTGTHKAYEYYFSHPPPFPKDAQFQIDTSNLGAFHSSEIIYVFNNLAIRKARDWPWTPTDWKLADMMSSYWVNFATKGDPNGPGLPVWPAYEEANQQVMNFGDPVRAISMPRTNELNFWDDLNHTQPTGNAGKAH